MLGGQLTRFAQMTEINTEGLAREIGVDEAVVSDVVARLMLVRGDLTDSGFHTLVRDVVRTKARFAERDSMQDLTAVRLGRLVD
jgi:hypothetical protein